MISTVLRTHLRAYWTLSVLLLSACGANQPAPSSSTPEQSQSSSTAMDLSTEHRLTPNDGSMIHFGRIDDRTPDRLTMIWQGSYLSMTYRGQVNSVEFSDLSGSAYFDVEVDGERLGMINARNGEVMLPSGTAHNDSQVHTFKLIKRSEASAGLVTIRRINITGQAIAQPPIHLSQVPELLFLGDSITAGACSEDGAEDQWDDRSTHNALVSYAAVTANHFDASYHNISISGVGISTGYQTTYTAPEIWDKYYPDPNSDPISFSSESPKIVFLNYGENDDSYTTNQGQPFPADFTQRYLNLLREIRQAFPDSAIVILRGGMWGGANSTRLRGPLEQVVNQFTSEDSRAFYYAFNHWSSTHPRTQDHQAMAAELISWIEQQGLMQ